MVARFASLVAVGLLVVPAFGQAPRKDAAAEMLAKLREPWKEPALADGRLSDLITVMTEQYDLAVIVKEDEFKQAGMDAVRDRTVRFPLGKGLGLRTVLNTVLAQVNGTFLVRKDHIEFLPIALAGKLLAVGVDDGDGPPRLAQMIVSAIVKEKPLNEVVADIAEEFDLNVVVAPQAGDSRMAFVSVRLLNVPADKALDVIATAADLRVVRKGNVFFITSRDHANEMFGEKLDKERQKIEVEKLRDAPAVAPPAPPPPPAKPEEKK